MGVDSESAGGSAGVINRVCCIHVGLRGGCHAGVAAADFDCMNVPKGFASFLQPDSCFCCKFNV